MEVANRPLSAWKIVVVNCGRVGFSLGGGSMRSDFDAQEAVRFVEGGGELFSVFMLHILHW